MDVYVLLDVLLVILVALFVPIGFWRGAYREAFVTLGILFGAALGRFWGETWGVELAAVSRLHESGGAFMIAMLSLISATFLLGYSSGAAIPLPNPGWMARTLGAVIAGANGALLLSFALRDIRVYLLSSDEAGFLDSAVIAPFLSEGTGWILLVAAAIFVPISLVLALFGPDVEEEEFFDEEDEEEEFELYEDDEYPEPYAQRTMQIDQRRPPFSRQKPPAPRAQAPRPVPAEETRPIQHVEQQEQTPSGAETHPAPPRPRVYYPQKQAPPPRPQTEPAARPEPAGEPQPEVRPRPEPGAQTPPVPETQPQPEVRPRPEPQDQTPAARSGANTQRPESRPAVDETQPHRPQFGPQPPPEAPRPGPEVEEPVFGAQTVAPPSDPPHSSEPPGVFGYIPTPESQTMRTGTDEFPLPVCPKCQADIRGASELCPSCGHRLTTAG